MWIKCRNGLHRPLVRCEETVERFCANRPRPRNVTAILVRRPLMAQLCRPLLPAVVLLAGESQSAQTGPARCGLEEMKNVAPHECVRDASRCRSPCAFS